MRHVQTLAAPSIRAGFHWIELVIVIAIIGLLAALFLPGVRNVRGAARRTQCLNNLRNIGLAVQNYEADYGALPPAWTVDAEGQSLHSWRTLLLPYLDQAALYESIDLTKSWEDPANAAAFDTVIEVYQCPLLDSTSNLTTYTAMVGPDACFLPTASRRLNEITDGTANTLMVIELPPAAAVPWMAPHDGGVDFLTKWPRDAELSHVQGINVMFADAHGQFLSADTSPELRVAMITVGGGESVDDR